jgi:hypothetical protein
MPYQNSFQEEFNRASAMARLFIIEAVGHAIQNPDVREQSFLVEEFRKLAGLTELPLSASRRIVREAQQVLGSFDSGNDEDETFHSWNVFSEVFILDGVVHYELTSSMYSPEMAELTLRNEPRYREALFQYKNARHSG